MPEESLRVMKALDHNMPIVTADMKELKPSYLLLSYLLLNHDRTVPFDRLMDVVHHLGASDSPYTFLNNAVYLIRRPLLYVPCWE